MFKTPKVSCVIFTYNEEVNLPHCLKSLHWCDDIVVVDSFSTDRTPEIAQDAEVRFFQHPFTGFGDQRNWVLDNVLLKHGWALFLDADERIPPEMVREFAERLDATPATVAAFRFRRRFYLFGRWLRYSSLYPTWVVRLIRVGRVRYLNRGHAETQIVEGAIEPLQHDLIDENHKDLHAWFARQNDYSTKEALHELSLPQVDWRDLFHQDPFRRREALKALGRNLPGRALWYFLYTYFLRRGFLEGMDGLRFCVMRSIYQGMIQLKKYELALKKAPDAGEQNRRRNRTSVS